MNDNVENMRRGRRGDTRQSYKDSEKNRAMGIMHAASHSIHQLDDGIIKRAAKIFSYFRDSTDRLTDFVAVVASCLLIALEECLVKFDKEFLISKKQNNSHKKLVIDPENSVSRQTSKEIFEVEDENIEMGLSFGQEGEISFSVHPDELSRNWTWEMV